jgi:hypothetical protein
LKEVLSTIGNAGLLLELGDQPVEAGVHVRFDRLQPPGVVDVVHRGNRFALLPRVL